MNGQDMINLITEILGGEEPNPTYLLTLINISKNIFEAGRPWKRLISLDNSQTVNGSNTWQTSFPLPPKFIRYLGESTLNEGSIILFDGNDNVQYLIEIPYENILNYKDQFGYFAVDYSNEVFYITGVVPGSFNIWQWYIKETDDITLTTTWTKFPTRFHSYLPFDTAVRWRLGTDYDDVGARNADDNNRQAEMLKNAMYEWDNELAISAVNGIDYYNDRRMNITGPRGTRANWGWF